MWFMFRRVVHEQSPCCAPLCGSWLGGCFRFPELSNFASPPAELGAYPLELEFHRLSPFSLAYAISKKAPTPRVLPIETQMATHQGREKPQIGVVHRIA